MRRRESDVRIGSLRSVWLFKGCRPQELRLVAQIVTEMSVEPGRTIATEGTTCAQFVVVAQGEASMTVSGERVGTVGPGACHGEVELLTGADHSATLTAVTPMVVFVLGRRDWNELLARSIPAVSVGLLTVLAERVQRTAACPYEPVGLGVGPT